MKHSSLIYKIKRKYYLKGLNIMKKNYIYSIIIFILLLIISNGWQDNALAEINNNYKWPRFSLVFQNINNYNLVAKKFSLLAGMPGSNMTALTSRNKDFLFFPVYGLIRTYRLLSNRSVPDYDYITTHHQDWLLKYKDGSLVMDGAPEVRGPRLDIGSPGYVDWVIEWLRQRNKAYGYKNFYLDGAMFYYGNPKWAKYDTDEAYRAAWEFFLRKIGQALRPEYKIAVNVGSSDLATFARMIQWIDGAFFEDVALAPFDKNFANLEASRKTIMDRLEKGKWLVEHGKIWEIRHWTTVKAIKLTPKPGAEPIYLSIGEQTINVLGPNQKVMCKLDLRNPENKTLANLSQSLQKFGLQATVISPCPETATAGAFQPLAYVPVTDKMVLDLKQPPRESFLFGYAAVLMAAGENTYFNLGSENNSEFYYPEMDWNLGRPRGDMREIAPFVYQRDFENYIVFLNLSDKLYSNQKATLLLPLRGALVKK
jgi:hypothetical protein